jgi:hypothetical protein
MRPTPLSRLNTGLPASRLAALLFATLGWSCGSAAASALSIHSPAPGASVVGEIAVYAEAGDSAEVAGVQFQVHTPDRESRDLGPELTAPPYAISWDTATAGDGRYRLGALAHLRDGSTSYAKPVVVTVANDPAPVRVEETEASIVWGDNWIHDAAYGPWSGGSAEYGVDAGTYAVFTFTGSGVSWIGYRGRYGGIVRVYIDGAYGSELDTWAPQEEIGVPVYTLTGLSRGTHSLLLQLTGLKNPEADDGEVVIDAFDVVP